MSYCAARVESLPCAGGGYPRAVLLSSIYFLLNFVNLLRAFYKVSNLRFHTSQNINYINYSNIFSSHEVYIFLSRDEVYAFFVTLYQQLIGSFLKYFRMNTLGNDTLALISFFGFTWELGCDNFYRF